jgi:hypothetical protein
MARSAYKMEDIFYQFDTVDLIYIYSFLKKLCFFFAVLNI